MNNKINGGAQQEHSDIASIITCPHTLRCLRRAGIETVEELRRYSYEDLLQLRGVGPVVAQGILEAMK